MTDQQINVAIAEACGWKWKVAEHNKRAGLSVGTWIQPDGEPTCAHPILRGCGELGYLPDYANDLNAMHEAVSWLFRNRLKSYWDYLSGLRSVVARDNSNRPATECIYAEDATARQRAEAFLRTIGKWQSQ